MRRGHGALGGRITCAVRRFRRRGPTEINGDQRRSMKMKREGWTVALHFSVPDRFLWFSPFLPDNITVPLSSSSPCLSILPPRPRPPSVSGLWLQHTLTPEWATSSEARVNIIWMVVRTVRSSRVAVLRAAGGRQAASMARRSLACADSSASSPALPVRVGPAPGSAIDGICPNRAKGVSGAYRPEEQAELGGERERGGRVRGGRVRGGRVRGGRVRKERKEEDRANLLAKLERQDKAGHGLQCQRRGDVRHLVNWKTCRQTYICLDITVYISINHRHHHSLSLSLSVSLSLSLSLSLAAINIIAIAI